MSDVSKSLRLLTKNKQPWAIRSGRSPKMSYNERIAQVSHQKWANKWIARFLERIAHLLIFLQKTSDLLRKPMSEFLALHKTTKSSWLDEQQSYLGIFFYLDVFDKNTWQGRLFAKASGTFTIANWTV